VFNLDPHKNGHVMNENVENKIVFQIMMYLHNENKINFKFYSDMTSF